MKKVFTDLQIDQGDAIPNWYGISYYNYALNTAVCYPFGIHLLVRWGRSLYWWLAWKRPDEPEVIYRAKQQAGIDGYARGYSAGFDVGYKSGHDAAYAELNTAVEREFGSR